MVMTLFDQLDKKQLKELLVKCWMTHDGSWFYNCARELGIDAANKLNKFLFVTRAVKTNIRIIRIYISGENSKWYYLFLLEPLY